jgi:hypothetical protein
MGEISSADFELFPTLSACFWHTKQGAHRAMHGAMLRLPPAVLAVELRQLETVITTKPSWSLRPLTAPSQRVANRLRAYWIARSPLWNISAKSPKQ